MTCPVLHSKSLTPSLALCLIRVPKHPSYNLMSFCDRSCGLIQGLFPEVVL